MKKDVLLHIVFVYFPWYIGIGPVAFALSRRVPSPRLGHLATPCPTRGYTIEFTRLSEKISAHRMVCDCYSGVGLTRDSGL